MINFNVHQIRVFFQYTNNQNLQQLNPLGILEENEHSQNQNAIGATTDENTAINNKNYNVLT